MGDRADAALQFNGGRCQNIDAVERGAYGGDDMEVRTADGRRSCWSGGGGRSCSGRRTRVGDLAGPAGASSGLVPPPRAAGWGGRGDAPPNSKTPSIFFFGAAIS